MTLQPAIATSSDMTHIERGIAIPVLAASAQQTGATRPDLVAA
jgi:hypothetical protein